MKEIKLTQGKVALVDDKDYDYLNQWKWHAARYGLAFYAVRSGGLWPRKRTIYMHRLLLSFPEGLQTDHKNGNSLDNQKANLRVCTCQQNHFNRRPQEGGTSPYKGIYWHKGTGKWQALISIKGTRKYLGLFTNELEAARAYDKAAVKYHGRFAWQDQAVRCKL